MPGSRMWRTRTWEICSKLNCFSYLRTVFYKSLFQRKLCPRTGPIDFTTIVNVKGATKLLKNGDHIVMNAAKGTIMR